MTNSIRIGGVCAIVAALSFLFGMAYYVFLLADVRYGNMTGNALEQLLYLRENGHLIQAWYLVIYVLFGFSLLGIQLGLNQLFRRSSFALAMSVLAFIWVGLVMAAGMVASVGSEMVVDMLTVDPEAAAHVWLTLQVLINGLGGGNEVVGGAWLLMLYFASAQHSTFPQVARIGALIVGVCGITTSIPGLSDLGAVFGLGCILWFLSIGLYMLLNRDH